MVWRCAFKWAVPRLKQSLRAPFVSLGVFPEQAVGPGIKNG